MSLLGSIGKGLLKGASSLIGKVPVVGDVVSGAIDDYLGEQERKQLAKEQIANSKELMTYQNELNQQNWQTQQEFNNFANDLTHMKEAGINPLAYGGSGQTPAIAGVTGASAPDAASLANYQVSMRLAQSQLKTQALEQEAQRYNNKALKAESDARIAESDARVAEARDRKAEAESSFKVKQRVGSAPEGEGWIFNDEANVWSRTNPETLTVEVVQPGTVRDDLMRSRIARELGENDLVQIQKELQRFETDLRKKFGKQLTSAQLRQVNSIIRNATLNGNLLELDEKWFSKLGLGPNVIRSIVSTAQAFSGELMNLVNSAGLIFAK